MIYPYDSPKDSRKFLVSSISRLPYVYLPLNEEAQEIRLLTILPGAFTNEVQVTLQAHAFRRNASLQFEALSYTWGSPRDLVNIFVTSPSSSYGTLGVTQNLAEALQYLRYNDKSRILWIDAICVDQSNMAERSSQVKRMADIYSAASRVVVWLGPDSNDSYMAMKCCQLISSNITVDWIRQAMSPASSDTHWADKEALLPFNETELAALNHFLDREWFKRLWIWQEVNLASDAVILCGTNILSWEAIRDTVFSIYMKSSAQYHQIDWAHRRLLHSLCKGHYGLSLDKLIENTKHSRCSDPRDKIFALFSLVSAYDEGLIILPNYCKPPVQIYEDFTRHYIQGRRHLKILSTIERHEENSELPSWVPNWLTTRITTPFNRTKFSGLSPASAKFTIDSSLEVLGLTVGTIEMVEPFRLSNPGSRESTSRNICLELRRITNLFNLRGLLDDESPNLINLCRVLCANTVLETLLYTAPDYVSFHSALYTLRQVLKHTAEELASDIMVDMKPFINSVITNCYGRSLFRCLDGTIGLAPRSARIGDKVAIWLGCDTDMILRPVRENQYRLIGEGVYDGAMDGSAFFGPLPERFRLVLTVVDKETRLHSAWAWRFLDRETGILSVEDPRLVEIELPLGWRRGDIEGEFLKDDTGERTMYDPRLTAEFLKSRGMSLEVFEIV